MRRWVGLMCGGSCAVTQLEMVLVLGRLGATGMVEKNFEVSIKGIKGLGVAGARRKRFKSHR